MLVGLRVEGFGERRLLLSLSPLLIGAAPAKDATAPLVIPFDFVRLQCPTIFIGRVM